MSHHFPDLTKMISDTPRTDDAYFNRTDPSMYDLAGEMGVLERELNAANERIKQLETENDAMRADLLLWNEKEAE